MVSYGQKHRPKSLFLANSRKKQVNCHLNIFSGSDEVVEYISDVAWSVKLSVPAENFHFKTSLGCFLCDLTKRKCENWDI